MKKLTLLLVAIILATTSAFSTDLLFDTNTVKLKGIRESTIYKHTKVGENKYAIYGIGFYLQDGQKIKSNHILTEIEYDKVTDKVNVNTNHSVPPCENCNYDPLASVYIKMDYNEDNGELSVSKTQSLVTNFIDGISMVHVPVREVFKDYKLLRSEYDSTGRKDLVVNEENAMIFNDDGSMSIYSYGRNAANDTIGIFKKNYSSDFKYKDFEVISPPRVEDVKALSGVDMIDAALRYYVKDVKKTKEGTLYRLKFWYRYLLNGKEYEPLVEWLMFVDNDNKLQYIIRPESLVKGEKHNIGKTILDYKDYFVFTTNRLGADSEIFSNNLFFVDKKTGKVVKNSKFGLKKNLYAFSIKLIDDHLWIIGHHDLNEKYSAGLYIYDIKHNVFRLSSHLGVHYDKVTSIFNGIQLNDNTVYLYGTIDRNNFFGVKYKFGESGVDIEASDNTSLKMHGELNRINLMVSSEETALGESTVEVYDITGKLLYSGKHELSSGTPLEIHNPAFVNGVYFVRVRNNAIDLSGKINL